MNIEKTHNQLSFLKISVCYLFKTLSGVFKKYFGNKHGVDLTSLNKRKPHDPTDFDE
ncbi:MAG TPA: hypothetical protein VJL60_00620 [Gammaproteobacteria bacterium]|nr:hypothetical protein [Gammaproteobacteria bacterium]